MIENKTDINKIFKEGFSVTYVDKGISALFKKRVERIKSDQLNIRSIDKSEIRPPINNIVESIQLELYDVLKLFSQNPNKILKNFKLIETKSGKEQQLDNLQAKQPAVACALIPPGDQEDYFKVFKVLYDSSGKEIKREVIKSIENEKEKATIIFFNASSLLYRWSIENKSNETSKSILVLFEELDCV